MFDFLTEVVKFLAAMAGLATAIVGLSAARAQRPGDKKKSHRR